MRLTPNRRRRTKGLTLVELTLAMALTLGIALAVLGMLQQQITLNKLFGQFTFLRDEAPQVNTLITNMISSADSYRIYDSLADAKASADAVRADGTQLRLRFPQPNGSVDAGIISFETINDDAQLNFYLLSSTDSQWGQTPNWTITSSPESVVFSNSTGILLIKIVGPNGEEITYAGNPE